MKITETKLRTLIRTALNETRIVGQILNWPSLTGNLLVIKQPVRGITKTGMADLDKEDSLELTGRVKHAHRPGEFMFEGSLDGIQMIWVKAKKEQFGMVPHEFITPQGKELGPEYFSTTGVQSESVDVNAVPLEEDLNSQVLRGDQLAKIARHLHDTGLIKNIIDVQSFLRDKAKLNVSKADALKIKALAQRPVQQEAADGSLPTPPRNKPSSQTAINYKAIQQKQQNQNKFNQNLKVMGPKQIKDLMKKDPELSGLPLADMDKRAAFLSKKYIGKSIPYSFLFFSPEGQEATSRELSHRANLTREAAPEQQSEGTDFEYVRDRLNDYTALMPFPMDPIVKPEPNPELATIRLALPGVKGNSVHKEFLVNIKACKQQFSLIHPYGHTKNTFKGLFSILDNCHPEKL